MVGSAQACGLRLLARRLAQLAVPVLLVVPSLSAAAPSETAAEPSGCAAPDWTTIASPNPGANANQLSALSAVSRSRAWAVGSSVGASGADVPLVAAWNGTAWTGSTPAGAAAGASRLNGVAAISASDAVAVGTTEAADGSQLPLVLRWGGSTWAAANPPAGQGDHRLLAVAAVSGSDVVAVGSTTDADGTSPLVLRWNGTDWTATHPDAGAGDHELSGVTAVSSSDLVAVGTTTTETGGKQPLVLRWNGTSWTATHPDPGAGRPRAARGRCRRRR